MKEIKELEKLTGKKVTLSEARPPKVTYDKNNQTYPTEPKSKKFRTCKKGQNFYEVYPDQNKTIEFDYAEGIARNAPTKKYKCTLADVLNAIDPKHKWYMKFDKLKKGRNETFEVVKVEFPGNYDARDSDRVSGYISYITVVNYLKAKKAAVKKV